MAIGISIHDVDKMEFDEHEGATWITIETNRGEATVFFGQDKAYQMVDSLRKVADEIDAYMIRESGLTAPEPVDEE